MSGRPDCEIGISWRSFSHGAAAAGRCGRGVGSVLGDGGDGVGLEKG